MFFGFDFISSHEVSTGDDEYRFYLARKMFTQTCTKLRVQVSLGMRRVQKIEGYQLWSDFRTGICSALQGFRRGSGRAMFRTHTRALIYFLHYVIHSIFLKSLRCAGGFDSLYGTTKEKKQTLQMSVCFLCERTTKRIQN